MGKQYRTPDGHVYEEQNGQFMLVDSAPMASPSPNGGLVIKPADPIRRALDAAELAAKAREAARAPVVDRKDRAEADRAEAEAAAARAKATQTADPRRAQAITDLNQDSTYRAIQQAQGDLGAGHATGLWSYLKPIPGTNAQLLGSDLSTINAQNMLGKLGELKAQSATGASGMGALSDTEGRILRDSIANLDQSLPQDRLLQNLKYIEQHYRRAAAISHGLDPDKVDLTERQAQTAADTQTQSLSHSGTHSVEDPTLKALGAHIGRMVANPSVSDQQVRDYMKGAGVNPADTNIDQALQFRRTRDFEAWQRKNPGKAYPIGENFYTKEVKLDPIASAVNRTAQSPLGAYAIAAGEGVTAQHLDNVAGALGGNAAQVRAGEDMVRAEHPYASLAGDISGQVLDEGVARALPGGQALLASKWGRRGFDAAYGVGAGQGAADDAPIGGAITGGIANALGGMAGRGAQRSIGNLATGARDEGLRYLHARGVPLTIGQIARPGADVGGKVVARLEDIATSIPGPGDFIRSTRMRGEVGLNRAGFNEGLNPIGGSTGDRVGGEAVDNMQNLTSDAYSRALDGVNVPHDPQFAADYAAARLAASKIPVHGDGLVHTLDTAVQPYLANGTLSGKDLQAALQTVRRESAAYDGLPGGTTATSALDNVENALTGLVRRQAPDVVPALDAANAAYRNKQILQSAVNGRGNELFTGANLRRASISNTKRFGGENAAASTNRPFYDLARHAIDIMPSTTPDSGTAARYLIPGAVGAAIGGGGGAIDAPDGQRLGNAASGAAKGLAVASLLSAPYTGPGQKAIQTLLLGQRLKAITAAGDLIKKYPWLGGTVGAGVSRDYWLNPEAQPAGQ